MADLELAEVLYPSGVVQFRYARYLAADGSRWIRHGNFRTYYPDGTLASEGAYEHGQESGLWRDYHPNGQLAAEGHFEGGAEVGTWSYWSAEGEPQRAEA
jgi:antitoxin component YwqK of YwqJK toxin-antitoxin module